ncbi:cobyric acid synthase [Suicoccus acidiformans]|nr:cobyric acid synthase [Suicoccus acidiformans]
MGRTLMIQGTASDSGKTSVVSALCRHFQQEGKKIFPFKSQNMNSQSYMTEKGEEIAYSQAIQAFAAKLPVDVRMNPILMKPTSDTGSNIIFNGNLLGHYSAREYFEMKPKLKGELAKVVDELKDTYDLVIIEGAGSPAEINLNQNDIVNMGMAEIADAPVIIVADIDLGGVFASIYGTLALLPEGSRSRVKGIIINKFRGDISLLQSGLDQIEELTGIPVIGVLPYHDYRLKAEDNLEMEANFDGLAELFREHVDMNAIERIIDEGA